MENMVNGIHSFLISNIDGATFMITNKNCGPILSNDDKQTKFVRLGNEWLEQLKFMTGHGAFITIYDESIKTMTFFQKDMLKQVYIQKKVIENAEALWDHLRLATCM